MTAISTEKHPETTHAHGPKNRTGSPAERFTSFDPSDFGVPTGREEEWRFTPLRPLRALFNEFSSARTVTIETDLPDGVTVTEVGSAHPLFGRAVRPADRVSALASAAVSAEHGALLVTIPAEHAAAEPVIITLSGAAGLNYAHLIIDAGPYSAATVVLDHRGETTLCANVETVASDGANITVISVQDWQPDAIHVAAHGALVNRDAHYTHISVTTGGKIVRVTPTVNFGGPGANAELFGLSFAGDSQHQESRLYIDHSAPNCSSNVVYKTVLDGDTARTVWIGDVRIRPTATGTSTYELNRNLLLTDGARADSVPNLEIETGEIAGAGHASATGRFDDLQLFYLQARGIPEDEARRLVVRGFLADVVNRITVPALRQRLMAAIDARLGGSAADDA